MKRHEKIISREKFSSGLKKYCLPDYMLAKMFNVPRSTISRWKVVDTDFARRFREAAQSPKQIMELANDYEANRKTHRREEDKKNHEYNKILYGDNYYIRHFGFKQRTLTRLKKRDSPVGKIFAALANNDWNLPTRERYKRLTIFSQLISNKKLSPKQRTKVIVQSFQSIPNATICIDAKTGVGKIVPQ